MAVERRQCATCRNGILGTVRRAYCSAACKQKAARRRRSKKAADSNADRNAPAVTVISGGRSDGVHCTEAVAVLAGLDAELAQSAKRAGRPLGWSTADKTLRELIASTIDRKTGLQRMYDETEDAALALKLAAELRLLTTQIAALLKQMKIDMPAAPSLKSQKASQAAHARWDRDRA